MRGSSKVALWPINPHNPAWVGSKQANSHAGMRTTPESGSALVRRHGPCAEIEGHLEVGMCRKLCADGRISDSVDALDRMLQGGCHVPNNIFYRVLKRCIQDKDLVLGTRIHALIIKSGYEGDAFLATHLIGLYASHGRLENANRVFTNVSTPDVYNWATIIFAYARHGDASEAAEAIRLYRQMRESTTLQPDDRIYSAVLKACAAARDLVAGKEVHAHILARPRKPDRFVQAGLVNMYAKCGSLDDARSVLDKLTERNIVACNAMLSGYAQQGMGQEALRLYRSIQQEGFPAANSVTYVCLLQACARVGVGALDQGKQLHVEIKERRLQEDVVLGGSLVNMYAKCGSLEDARIVFDKLSDRDVVIWTAMIAGYAQQGMGQEALSLYRRMQQEGLTPPDSVTFVCLLKACASVGVGAFDEGKQLHAQIKERGLQEDAVLGGSLLNMYAKCGSLEDARIVFNKLSDWDVVKWTAMIAGYVQQGMGQEALNLYRSMQHEGLTPDSVTYVCLLQACASVGVQALDEGKQLHAQIKGRGLQEDMIVGGSLVNMYAKCGSLQDARCVFDMLPEKNIVACNAMLAGYAHQAMGQEALGLYKSMQQGGLIHANSVTYVCLLQACASVGIGGLREGMQLHAQIKEQALQEDRVVGVSLINMYAKCGSLQDARELFDKIPERNVVAWNAMMAGYAHQGTGQEALCLYKSMQQEGLTLPDAVTYVCLLQACARLGAGALDEGKQLHAHIQELGLQEDRVVAVSLVNMYAKCGSLKDARRLFDNLSERSVVAWNAMIVGYAQQGMGQEAISLYRNMQEDALTPPDCVTYVWLLQVCAALAALPLGEQLHAEMKERGMQADGIVGAALVNMYAKCGSMYDAQRVFDALPERSMEAWGALISGYAHQGDSQVVFDLLDRMRLEGVHPNEIMFLSVLTVCSHVGLVDKGRECFKAMTTEYGISATMEHFICMVDLLGRAGHLDEALQMAKTMPSPPQDVWYTLLGACRKWKNVEIGQQAFNCAVSMDEKDAASYVLMSNIYASAGMWEAAKKMQAMRRNLGAWKKPGQSWWTDVDGVVHTFFVGDKKHPESEDIYARLEQLVPKMKEGYVRHLQSW